MDLADARDSIRMLEEAVAALRQQVRELRAENERLREMLDRQVISSGTTSQEEDDMSPWELA